MGRPRTPTPLKVLAGQKDPGINAPVPATGEVLRPTNLSEGAAGVWDRLAPDLVAKGVLTPWDVDLFAAFCDAIDRRDRAAAALDEEGEIVDAPVFNRNGEQTGRRRQLNPWWFVWRGANDFAIRYGGRFGLSPSERAGLNLHGGRSRSPGERFFDR